MLYQNNVFNKLTKLAKMTACPLYYRNPVVEITCLAFFNKKPLFNKEEKPKAAKLMVQTLPFFHYGYIYYCRGMHIHGRQEAQMSRSGLQYLVEEFKDDEEVFDKLKPIFNAPSVKCIEQYIEYTTGIPPDHSDYIEMDLSKIPSSHFWWFFVEDEDDK